MKTNGHVSPVRFGDLMGFDPEPGPPPTEFTIVQIERAASGEYADCLFDLLEGDRAILRGDGISINAELRSRGLTAPGTLIGMRFPDGRYVVFRQRTPTEVLAGEPACLWRSDRQRPAVVRVVA